MEVDALTEPQQQIIDLIVSKADEVNRGWLRAYLEKNIARIIIAVGAGQPILHGFRGFDVEDAIKELRTQDPTFNPF